MSSSIAKQINDILEVRKSRVPQLEELLHKCDPAEVPLRNAAASLKELADNFAEKPVLVEVCREYVDHIEKFQEKLATLKKDVFIARQRFLRGTVNIGFAGTKGTGKSFLLQKLSGLTDNEVPSAEGMPVTAVRSVIMNSEENRAHIAFFTSAGFLAERIAPFCNKLGLDMPTTLDAFRSLSLPEHCERDEDDIYRQKLAEYRDNLAAYEGLLGTGERIFDLKDLRQYVSYTIPNMGRLGGKKVYNWLAVESARIKCTFPRSDVGRLQLIDLPGLGELDPSLDKRHTDNFKELLDLCLYIRRPAGTRMDWDQEAQKALDTLSDSCPAGKPSDFIVMVINAGGCKNEMAEIMENETRQKMGSRYKILKADSSDSEGLSSEVLSKALQQLADVLPQNDQALAADLFDRYGQLKKQIKAFVDEAKRILRKEGQDDTLDEVIREKAKKAQEAFAEKSEEVLEELAIKAFEKKEEPQELLDALDEIESSLRSYLENGMDEKTYEDWIKQALRSRAKERNFDGFKTNTFNHMRVHIAKEFSASLNSIYRMYVERYQAQAVATFNDKEVLNGLLPEDKPASALKKLVEYMDQCCNSVENMRRAVSELLDLKIDHDTQFYPRVYEPIRVLKNAVEKHVDLEGSTHEERARSLYTLLADLGTATVSDIRGLLIQEVRSHLYNILYVAFERFDDAIIRSHESDRDWLRFFQSYHLDIVKNGGKASAALVLNKAFKHLDALGESLL